MNESEYIQSGGRRLWRELEDEVISRESTSPSLANTIRTSLAIIQSTKLV